MLTSELIDAAFLEDIGSGDITSEATIPKEMCGRGVLLAKQEMVLAGLEVACDVFLRLDPLIQIKKLAVDGDSLSNPTPVMELEGSYRTLLRGERVALNFLARLCGVATMTRKFVVQTSGTNTKILDTRKTTPLFRDLEKAAVVAGGGVNHRMGLYDAILIKDNHLAACQGDVTQAIFRVKEKYPKKPITVEIAEVKDVKKAIAAGADRILLDNMNDEEVREAVLVAQNRVEIEVSGGITENRVRRLSEMGVDYISVGAITHSAPSVDLSLEIIPQ